MIVYQKAGKSYLLLANSSRGVMKISSSLLLSSALSRLNNQLSSGMRPSPGVRSV